MNFVEEKYSMEYDGILRRGLFLQQGTALSHRGLRPVVARGRRGVHGCRVPIGGAWGVAAGLKPKGRMVPLTLIPCRHVGRRRQHREGGERIKCKILAGQRAQALTTAAKIHAFLAANELCVYIVNEPVKHG